MTLDSLSYTAPSRIRALLCPLGRIKRARFASFVERLQVVNVVRLGDVTPDSRPNRTTFSPQGFPDGQVVYDLSTSCDREHESLELFELYRRTYLVLAIADHVEGNSPELLSKQLEELKFHYPTALHHVCLVFDSPSESPAQTELSKQRKDENAEYPAFIPVPPKQDSRTSSLRTLMCDVTSAVLSEISGLAKSLQALATIDSPLSPEAQSNGTPKNHRMSVPSGASSGSNGSGGASSGGGASLASKRMTMTGFGSGSVSERARNKGKGRVQIAVAQLYLLAGRVPDALKEFVDGAEVAKANNDHLWHGKALECIGVCMVILAYLKHNFQIPYPTLEAAKAKSSPSNSKPGTPVPPTNGTDGGTSATSQQIISMLPDLLNTALNLYARSANFPGENIPQICYSEAVLRHCKVLTAMHLANGSNDAALANLAIGTTIPPSGSNKNIPSRVEISTTVMRAYPQPVETMTVLEATRVLSGIASILGSIGLKRRKALVTRELLKILIPGLIQARVVGAAEVGVHPAAGLSALSGGLGGNSPLDLGEGDVETGIMELLEDLCRSYGIYAGLRDGAEEERPLSSDAGEYLRTAVATKEVIAEQEIRSFGWPALKIHVLRNCTALCEALPDFQGVLKFTTQLLRTADMELTREEQMRLSTTISRTVGAARKLGLINVEADYWDQFLLRDVELVEHPIWRSPTAHNRAELLDVDPDNPEPATAEPVFIYNPFSERQESSDAEKLLVKGETAEFKVTLQNPFEFDVEVESVTLDATGVDIEVQSVGVVIAPFRTFLVSVFATPKECGDIHINGCKIKVFGCRERSFPIFTEGLDSRERDPKTKRYGLKAAQPTPDRPISTISARSSLRPPPVLHPIPKALSLTVVDAQPLLTVTSTSLSQSAIMVLEGERKVFQMTLQNLTPTEVDLLMFNFADSTTGRIQQALIEKGNSPAEMYELELMLSKKRAFVWHRPERNAVCDDKGVDTRPQVNGEVARKPPERRRIFVPANGSATFEIEVLGKPGLTHGTIQVDYGHLGRPRSTVTDAYFHTRRLLSPVTVTVNASIELVRVDFVPFSTNLDIATTDQPFSSNATSGVGLAEQFRELFAGIGIKSDPAEYCLVLLDLRNAWPQPLRVHLSVGSDGNDFTAEDVLQAGHTSRVILPIKRIFLTNPTAPIPSLTQTQRQFVVSSTKVSLEQERQSREAFWYRESLLQSLRGTWQELNTDRKGDIELRGIRLSTRMVETLRIEDIGISLNVGSEPGEAKQLAGKRYLVKTDAFLTLLTTVTNRTSRRVRPIVRLLPALRNQPPAVALDLNRRFAVNGLLQSGLKPLEPGESRTVKTGFVCLAKGEYEVSASVEEVGTRPDDKMPDGDMGDILKGILPGSGRKCWVCREVLVVVARDVGEVREDGAGAEVKEGAETGTKVNGDANAEEVAISKVKVDEMGEREEEGEADAGVDREATAPAEVEEEAEAKVEAEAEAEAEGDAEGAGGGI